MWQMWSLTLPFLTDLPIWKTVFWGKGQPGLLSTTTLHHPLTSALLPGVPVQHDWGGIVAHQTPNPGGTLQHKDFTCSNTVIPNTVTAICHMWAGPVILLLFGIFRDSPPASTLAAMQAGLTCSISFLDWNQNLVAFLAKCSSAGQGKSTRADYSGTKLSFRKHRQKTSTFSFTSPSPNKWLKVPGQGWRSHSCSWLGCPRPAL